MTPSNEDRPIRLDELSRLEAAGSLPDKVELSDAALAAWRDEDTVLALVKVARDGYVPPGCQPRARVSERLFSTELDGATLRALAGDPLVESVSVSRRLRTSDPDG